jgi:DNA-binding CsgD family transcriptional regulator
MASEDPATGGWTQTRTPTVLGFSLVDRLVIGAGAPLLGAGLGYLLPHVATWALKLPWVPLQGPLKLVASVHGPWAVAAFAGLGAVLGAGVAVLAIVESLKVTLTDNGIRLASDGKVSTVARPEVAAVFVDGRRLVVLDRDSRQLVRETCETKAAEIARAFRAHGYPWVDGDPYAALYRRWAPDTPDLPAAANALLRAREVAVAVGEGKSNAEIGADLHMSVATVKTYVSRILAKLECANRVQVAILVHDSRG